MKKFRPMKPVAFLLVVAMVLILAACGGSTNSSTDSVSSGIASETAQSTQAATVEEKVDPMGKYDPGIEVTATRWTTDGMKFTDNETLENNKFTKYLYEDKLGIKIKYQWLVPQAQFDQKMSMSIASGDLADLMLVNMKQLKMLAGSDMLMDIGPVFDKYASPILKEAYAGDKGTSFNLGKLGGKQVALPTCASPLDVAPILWIRTDWLQNLNLPEPKTMNDLFAIIDAFANKDPDGNGKNDTFGLGLGKDLYDTAAGGWVASLNGFFAGYHAYPNMWIKDAQGNLVNGSLQPEVKTVLQKLQDMYKAGMIDKEFAVKDGGKIADDITKGKIGIQYGAMWNPFWPLQGHITADPKAEWKPFPLVSIDDKAAAPGVGIKGDVMNFLAVNKNAKNPEAAVKIANAGALELATLLTGDDSLEDLTLKGIRDDYVAKKIDTYYLYQLFNADASNKNLIVYQKTQAALKGEAPLSAAVKSNVSDINAFEKDGNRDKWGVARYCGPISSYGIIEQFYNIPNNMVWDEFFGVPTQTMTDKLPTLSKMQLEVFTKIIMGDPIATFDKFVEDYNNLGGNEIAKEVNEWYKNK